MDSTIERLTAETFAADAPVQVLDPARYAGTETALVENLAS